MLLSPGLRPCSPMRMLSHVSELPCLTLPICLVCPQADGKASKQNSCLWQYKMSLHGGYGQLPQTCELILTGQMPHVALCCLECSTMSNLVHRRRRCARIVLYTILCLEGSTPEDGGGAFPLGEGNRCGSSGAFLYCQRQLFCFLGA